MSFTKALTLACAVVAFAACGTLEVDGELSTPEQREARVSLTPAFDLSPVVDEALASRVRIDEIIINISDIRLLGANPRIPTGGLALIENDHLLVDLGDESFAHFPIPENLLSDDLAVYIRIEPTPELDFSAVIVRGQLYEGPEHTDEDQVQNGLRAKQEKKKENSDPDGEPAHGVEDLDPDGEPAHEERQGALDPDGEPASCPEGLICQGLWTSAARSVSFELRSAETADLVLDFEDGAALDAILHVPAGKWFTPEVVAELEKALFDSSVAERKDDSPVDDERTIVIEEREAAAKAFKRQSGDERCDDYSLEGRGHNGYDPRTGRPPR